MGSTLKSRAFPDTYSELLHYLCSDREVRNFEYVDILRRSVEPEKISRACWVLAVFPKGFCTVGDGEMWIFFFYQTVKTTIGSELSFIMGMFSKRERERERESACLV